MSPKVFLRIQLTAGKLSSCVHGVPSVCCQRDKFIISQCILLQFRKLMKSICSPDANSVHIRFQMVKQIADKLKTIHAVHQLFHMLNLAWLFNARITFKQINK